jgi:hypothetical protein
MKPTGVEGFTIQIRPTLEEADFTVSLIENRGPGCRTDKVDLASISGPAVRKALEEGAEPSAILERLNSGSSANPAEIIFQDTVIVKALCSGENRSWMRVKDNRLTEDPFPVDPL